MVRLSSPIQAIKDYYQVVVVGSGYGGSIAASRLARAGQEVCLLERGRELQPGEYPDTEGELLRETQMNTPLGRVGRRTALYEFHVNEDMTALVGCGLGGTSLINASVALRPDPRVFEDLRWPEAFRADIETRLAEGYRCAEEMLRPNPYPDAFPPLPKLDALRRSAEALGAAFYRLPINVTFEDGVNHVGVEQKACILCGDCASGCNHRAKNTTLMNYLPDAWNHGATLFTEVSVHSLERRDEKWLVHYHVLDAGQEAWDTPVATVSADIVILAAGTLGSTEIMLRSKAAGLPLSDKVGEFFSGNGDVGGAAYNADVPINAIGFGARPPGQVEPVGPTITGVIDLRGNPAPLEGVIIEEGTLSGPFAAVLPQSFVTTALFVGKDTDSGLTDAILERRRELQSLIRGARHGAVNNTQFFLVMTHDDSNGRLILEDDRLRIDWPGIGQQPFVERVNGLLAEAARAIGGTFATNPLWSMLPAANMITSHPLGGCVMAEDATRGVVSHKGQVFAGASGDAVYESLYIGDGSVIPRSIGANPLLTISAIAERACRLLAEDRGWEIAYDLPSAPPIHSNSSARVLGLEFTESMAGYLSLSEREDYQEGFRKGKEEDSPFRFIVTILADDLEQMIADPNYTARFSGVVIAPALSPEALTVTEGRFNALLLDPEAPSVRRMRYRMRLTAQEGTVYYCEGFKVIRDDRGMDLWADTTTLYTTLYAGEDAGGLVLGRGILNIHLNDFQRQMRTVEVRNATSQRERLDALARFGHFFAGSLFDIYGGIFARPSLFDPEAPPRKKRELGVAAPEVHWATTPDGVQLRLTRYRGGGKGPVMLVHGLGVSSLAFSIDTIDVNLLEYLFGHDYDVWLLDYRSSIELPASQTQYSADDIARYDLPTAVETIRAATGADSIQAVVHCYGAITFHMAMLAGMSGVRSAVSSQVGAHLRVIPANRLRSAVYMDALLDKLGVEALTMYTDRKAGWLDRLYNRALSLNPVIEGEERCNNPVCHRVTFLYAPLYEHDQLNSATHNVVHELFGVATMSNFRHLGLLSRTGHLVTADGQEAYMPHAQRLAIPIAYIHGAENETWLPESTQLTYDWLREHNGAHLYKRHLIPLYGHIDCIFGKNAYRDVYPLILQHLEESA